MTKWTVGDIPHLHGRTAVVTGTGGLGLETALELARAGCEVTIAGRNPGKGVEAVAHIKDAVPGAAIRFGKLDLTNLSSVATFAQQMENEIGSLDILINNAGVMLTPKRQVTSDGFELQLGTNYLGHFALTARLKPLLSKGKDARVVSLSSLAANGAAFISMISTCRRTIGHWLVTANRSLHA